MTDRCFIKLLPLLLPPRVGKQELLPRVSAHLGAFGTSFTFSHRLDAVASYFATAWVAVHAEWPLCRYT